MLELTMTVSAITRFPFIGTFAVTLPRTVVSGLYRYCRAGAAFFNFELHAVDVLDGDDGIPDALTQRQRDLRVPHSQKLERLREVFSWLKRDYEVLTLESVAARLSAAR